MYGDVEVVDTDRHPGGRAAIAGTRPPHDQLWREKAIRVRLVREHEDPDDPNAIAVLGDAGEWIGQVCRESARRMAPAIDSALCAIAAKRSFKGCAVDIYCTALVVAGWDGACDDAGADAPGVLEVTLLVDDGDLGLTVTAPAIPICV